MSGNRSSVLNGAGQLFRNRQLIGKIAIQKMVPQRSAWADFTFSTAVIRDKETNAGIQHKMQITVEVDGIATVADNPVPVARLFIKSQAHAVERLMQARTGANAWSLRFPDGESEHH